MDSDLVTENGSIDQSDNSSENEMQSNRDPGKLTRGSGNNADHLTVESIREIDKPALVTQVRNLCLLASFTNLIKPEYRLAVLGLSEGMNIVKDMDACLKWFIKSNWEDNFRGWETNGISTYILRKYLIYLESKSIIPGLHFNYKRVNEADFFRAVFENKPFSKDKDGNEISNRGYCYLLGGYAPAKDFRAQCINDVLFKPDKKEKKRKLRETCDMVDGYLSNCQKLENKKLHGEHACFRHACSMYVLPSGKVWLFDPGMKTVKELLPNTVDFWEKLSTSIFGVFTVIKFEMTTEFGKGHIDYSDVVAPAN